MMIHDIDFESHLSWKLFWFSILTSIFSQRHVLIPIAGGDVDILQAFSIIE